jgi:hypothetical protein
MVLILARHFPRAATEAYSVFVTISLAIAAILNGSSCRQQAKMNQLLALNGLGR